MLLVLSFDAPAADPLAVQRENMVRKQIAARGVSNPSVLKAMSTVPRHLFVSPEYRANAYEDRPLPIARGQTISQPYMVAAMTEFLEVDKSHKVLEIGTGSGYQAAVLSLLAKRVFTIEIVPELAASSRALLEQLHYSNISVRQGDGYLGWPEEAPFDRIILTAAPKQVPQALIDQLKPGGRLLAPIGTSPLSQELILISKDRSGALSRRSLMAVSFVPMVH